MTTIVIDANVALALVVPLAYSDRVIQLMEEWQEGAILFVVPALWGYEVVSGLRKAVTADVLTEEEAERAIQALWALDIEEVPATVERHRQALIWSERLGQTVAYDAQYMMVAEELDVPLWTADRPLSKAARAAGDDWVHWIGEDR
jgi:predicted nucleic acid-binding protein